MENCIFCKIVQGTIPDYRVYEDDKFIAFLDVFPRTKGHTLLIPKQHIRWVYEVEDFGGYWNVAQKITQAMQKSLSPTFVTYLTHGMDVPHAHIHIMPRFTEKVPVYPDVLTVPKEEMSELAVKIKAAL